MGIFFVILISLAGLAFSIYNLKKNLAVIKEKNKKVESPWKRASNYFTTALWYGYQITFFIGLTVNNLIFT